MKNLLILAGLFCALLALSACLRSGVRTGEQQENTGNAQARLADLCDPGRDAMRSPARAAASCRKAAEQGNAAAQNSLGTIYRDGEGVAPDDEEAVRWYRRAADQGYGEAFSNLAYMYENGLGVDRDKQKAIELCLLGAEKKDPASMIDLGVSYWKGEGVKKSLVKAIMWLELAGTYTQGSSNKQLKWRIRATKEEMTLEAKREEIDRAGWLAQEWEEAHAPK